MSANAKPHILVFPFPSSGHIIPILDFTDQLLRRNLTVTVIVTTAKHLSLLSPLLTSYPHSLHSLFLSPPEQSTFKPSKIGLITDMRRLTELGTPIRNWFKSHPSPPIAIISDFFLGWTHDLAVNIGVPRLTFSPSGAFYTSVYDYLWRYSPQRNSGDNDIGDDVLVTFNRVPDSPAFPWWQLSPVYRFWKHDDPDFEFFKNGFLNNLRSWGMVFNSFTELERVYLDHIKTEKGDDRVWAVGPLLPNIDGSDFQIRGGSSSVSSEKVLKWLDQRSERSVVYVCFGTTAILGRGQMEVLTAGLESSGVQFVLCVRDPKEGRREEDQGTIPIGYEDRVKDRGFIITGWAPQVAILKHKAVGAFLTHCGWNSVLEGLCAGVVMLTWPIGIDQFANAMLLVDLLGVGIRVGEATRNVPDSNKLAQVLVEALDETQPEKARALELKNVTQSARKAGSSSQVAIDDVIKKLSTLAPITGRATQFCLN